MNPFYVIGIDGCDPHLLEKWVDQLPTFRRLMENGVYGKLKSTIPPLTCPAWNSMFTGKNPGKLGLFDWLVLPFYRKNGLEVVRADHQDSPWVWDLIGDAGVKVGIVGVPTTYPAKPVNGFIVSGGPAIVRSNHIYPPSLEQELKSVAQDFRPIPLVDLQIPDKEEEYLEEFENHIEKAVLVLSHLLTNHPCDLFVYVFSTLDCVQHYFWKHQDESHPKYDPRKASEYKNVIKDFYIKIDRTLSKLLSHSPRNSNLIIVSDHGFGSGHGHFFVNDWLRRMGFLKLKNEQTKSRTILYSVLERIKKFTATYLRVNQLQILARIVPSRFQQLLTGTKRLEYQTQELIEAIDWSKTKAYGIGTVGSIYLNVKDREPWGVVDGREEYIRLREMIVAKLREMSHSRGNAKPYVTTFMKESVYEGEYVDFAPDILYLIDDLKYAQNASLKSKGEWLDSQISGFHRMDGTFIAYGPDIERGGKELLNLRIYDIAPTILYAFGIPLPPDLDGRVIREIFDKNSGIMSRPITYSRGSEKRLIKERVKKLKAVGKL